MTGADDDLARAAWRAISALVFAHDRRTAVAEELGLSFGRLKVLRRLLAGPLTLRELAARLGADPPWVTIMVGDLEERGLVERRPHPTDRRAKTVSLTPDGRALALRAQELLDEPPPAVRALPPSDLALLARLAPPAAEEERG